MGCWMSHLIPMNQMALWIAENDSTVAANSSLTILLRFEIVAASLTYGLGFLGNLFALIVFSLSAEFRRISTGILFLLMAISNFFHLWTLTLEFLVICGYHIYPNSFLKCRLNFYIQNLTRSMSIFFSVGISIDRLIRSEIPLRSRVICTRKNTFIITIIILILLSIFWFFYLLPYSDEDPITGICIYNQSASFEFFLLNIDIPLRAILFCLLPILIMIIANIRMVHNIRQAHRRIAALPQIYPANKSSTMISSTAVSEQPGRRTLVIDRMLLYMLTSSVLTFIVTQTPFHLYMIIEDYVDRYDDYTRLLIYALLLIWSSIYFGIAFYLYCLASPLFRKKSFRIIRKVIRDRMTS